MHLNCLIPPLYNFYKSTKFLLYYSALSFGEELFYQCPNIKFSLNHSQSTQEEMTTIQNTITFFSKIDLSYLKFDSSERAPILEHPLNHRNLIRRTYLLNDPCLPHPQLHQCSQVNISGSMHRFNHKCIVNSIHDLKVISPIFQSTLSMQYYHFYGF